MEVVHAQAAERVALQFVPQRTATWDHHKAGRRVLAGHHDLAIPSKDADFFGPIP
jgi:hypothetical protein